ncbi:MAG: hypothetical protein E7386_07925 [Ruminococcaceae bacterium]|nr:hypothetical protein [Oscillospiraceae bacterium]
MKGVFTKTRALISVLLLAVLTVFVIPQKSDAASYNQDEILYYGIEAHLLDTGSVQFTYTIDWKVLDSKNGGVKWVKIGIPNPNAENFRSLTSDTIKSVKYYSDKGSFARVDFHKEYMAGEVIHFSFGFTQHNLFKKPNSNNPNVKTVNMLNEQDNWDRLYVYDFTPGWFPTIRVDKYEIKWDASKVVKSNEALNGQYYYQSGSLAPNKRASFKVGYPPGAYSFTTKSVAHLGEFLRTNSQIFLGIGFMIFVIFMRIKYGDTYTGHGTHHHYHGGDAPVPAQAAEGPAVRRRISTVPRSRQRGSEKS